MASETLYTRQAARFVRIRRLYESLSYVVVEVEVKYDLKIIVINAIIFIIYQVEFIELIIYIVSLKPGSG